MRTYYFLLQKADGGKGMIKNIIDFLIKLSNLFNYIAENLRKLSLHEEYYVYVPTNNKPRYIHKNYISAKNEAIRLTDKIPSGEYIEILQIVNRFEGEKIPF